MPPPLPEPGASDDAPDLVVYEKDGPIAWITLNRPYALNAVNLAMRDLLWTWLEAVRDDPEVEVAILRGNGRNFCAGADVKEFGSAPSYLAARNARLERDLWGAMLDSQKPMIAAVHGWALGAGCEMGLYCDFRIAAEDVRFGLPEVKLGYIPSAGGTQTLPRHIPPAVALEMVLTGEPVDAPTALRHGLVHQVVTRGQLYAAAEQLAQKLLARPAGAVRLAREALAAARDLPLDAGLRVAARLGARAQAERRADPAAGGAP